MLIFAATLSTAEAKKTWDSKPSEFARIVNYSNPGQNCAKDKGCTIKISVFFRIYNEDCVHFDDLYTLVINIRKKKKNIMSPHCCSKYSNNWDNFFLKSLSTRYLF